MSGCCLVLQLSACVSDTNQNQLQLFDPDGFGFFLFEHHLLFSGEGPPFSIDKRSGRAEFRADRIAEAKVALEDKALDIRVAEHVSERASRDTAHASDTSVIVDQNSAERFIKVNRIRGTCLHACRIDALKADFRNGDLVLWIFDRLDTRVRHCESLRMTERTCELADVAVDT